MNDIPVFPQWKSIELTDQPFLQGTISAYGPNTSEWTFTNLFIWRSHYRFRWSVYKDWVFVICQENGGSVYALQPIGPEPRFEATIVILEWLNNENHGNGAVIERADHRLAYEFQTYGAVTVEPARDHFDYVYLRDDLVALEGNRYRSKRNHINKLMKTYHFTYQTLDAGHIEACLALQEKWCQIRRCREDLNLMGEWEAVEEILRNFGRLPLIGGVIIIEGTVGAFTVGEMLNGETAVVHIEKADPVTPGLFPMINREFCRNAWDGVTFINREQDLGIPGLREAKLSYYPHHFEEKFRISRTNP